MSAMRRAVAVVLLGLVVTACDEDRAETSDSDSAVPDILAAPREACEKDGGRWGTGPGQGTFVCYRRLSDANSRCETGRDCQGLCLARSRTCSPVKPFYGCHEIVSDTGLRQTLCVE